MSLGITSGFISIEEIERLIKTAIAESEFSISGTIKYKGVWDAYTNIPHIDNNIGILGDAYIVSNISPSFVIIDGISELSLGDLIVFNGLSWQRIHGGLSSRLYNLIIDNNLYVNNIISNSGDINLIPEGSNFVNIPRLKIPEGSIIEGSEPIQISIADLILYEVANTQPVGGLSIPIGTYGNSSEIPAPWTVYKFTSDPNPVLEIGDIISGTGIPYYPIQSGIVFVGEANTQFSSYVVANTSLYGLPYPEANTIIHTIRQIINAGFFLSTNPNTDIALLTGNNGHIIINSDIIPLSDRTLELGSPARRFYRAYFGGGTIYILDETLGIDQAIGARDGNFYIKGGTGLSVGEFNFKDNKIFITDLERDIEIGVPDATGKVIFNRGVTIESPSGTETFSVDRNGLITINPPIQLGPTQSAVSIIGSSSGNQRPRNFSGTLLQITSQDDMPARISLDSFGNASYGLIAARSARGSVDSPEQTLSGDTLLRLTSQGWSSHGDYHSSIVRINHEAAQDFQLGKAGTRISFQTTPIDSTTIQTSATIDSNNFSLLNGTNLKFSDGSLLSTTPVNSLAIGKGLENTGSNINPSINATGVQSISSYSNNQILISNVNQDITLSLPQDISRNSTVEFNNVTVTGILNVTGNTVSTPVVQSANTILYLGYNSNNIGQIQGGGIVLGANNIAKHFIYDNISNVNRWDTGDTNFKTNYLFANNISSYVLDIKEFSHFGSGELTVNYPNAIIQIDSNISSYSQVIHQNHSNHTSASSDYIAVNDIGNDSNNYIDIGINSSTYSDSSYTITKANDGYVFVNGGNLTIGTQSENSKIIFHTSGTLSNNQVGYISSDGRWVFAGNGFIDDGSSKLQVNGNIKASTFIGNLNGTANNALHVPYSGLTGTIPIWNQNTTGTANTANFSSNLSGNASNQIVVQIANNTTSFISAPNISNSVLKWTGNNYIWASSDPVFCEIWSSFSQTANNSDTVYSLKFDNIDGHNLINLGSSNSEIIINSVGYYDLKLVGCISEIFGNNSVIYIWVRKNGVDIPFTGIHFTIANGQTSITNFSCTINCTNIGDYFEIMWASSKDGIEFKSSPALLSPFPMPACPSVSVNINKI